MGQVTWRGCGVSFSEIFKCHLDVVLDTPFWVALMEQELDQMASRGFFPSQPSCDSVKHSVLNSDRVWATSPVVPVCFSCIYTKYSFSGNGYAKGRTEKSQLPVQLEGVAHSFSPHFSEARGSVFILSSISHPNA